MQQVLEHYRERRSAILAEQASRIDVAVDWVKRREGFERLSPDAQYEVVAPLREKAALNTDASAIQPELAVLGSLFQARLEAAQARSIAHLDELLEKKLGGPPTVEVSLELEGRVITDAAELDRLLAEVREQILHQLEAKHRVSEIDLERRELIFNPQRLRNAVDS